MSTSNLVGCVDRLMSKVHLSYRSYHLNNFSSLMSNNLWFKCEECLSVDNTLSKLITFCFLAKSKDIPSSLLNQQATG